MSLMFDPKEYLKKVLPKDFERKKILNNKIDVKREVLSSLTQAKAVNGREIKSSIYNTVEHYKHKYDELRAQGLSVKGAVQEATGDEALLRQRIYSTLIYDEVQELKQQYAGWDYKWLPSEAENPDPEHQLLYGKIFKVGRGDKNGFMPGERWGCRCGIEFIEPPNPSDKTKAVKINFKENNILPALNQADLKSLGVKNKPVVFKQRTLARNINVHPDIPLKDYSYLAGKALYERKIFFRDSQKKNYIHFIGEIADNRNSVVLLDIDETKSNFEIVHLQKMNKKGLERLLKNKKRS